MSTINRCIYTSRYHNHCTRRDMRKEKKLRGEKRELAYQRSQIKHKNNANKHCSLDCHTPTHPRSIGSLGIFNILQTNSTFTTGLSGRCTSIAVLINTLKRVGCHRHCNTADPKLNHIWPKLLKFSYLKIVCFSKLCSLYLHMYKNSWIRERRRDLTEQWVNF